MVRRHFAESERHFALGEKHIARQIEIIDEIGLAGGDTRLARDLLDTYRAIQQMNLSHQDTILKELGA